MASCTAIIKTPYAYRRHLLVGMPRAAGGGPAWQGSRGGGISKEEVTGGQHGGLARAMTATHSLLLSPSQTLAHGGCLCFSELEGARLLQPGATGVSLPISPPGDAPSADAHHPYRTLHCCIVLTSCCACQGTFPQWIKSNQVGSTKFHALDAHTPQKAGGSSGGEGGWS